MKKNKKKLKKRIRPKKKKIKKAEKAKAEKAKISSVQKRAKISKKTPAKKAPKVSKEVVKEEDILKLIEKGRHRGFVTESEIMHAFPFIEKDIEGLERLYERLEASNINIIETGKVFEQ